MRTRGHGVVMLISDCKNLLVSDHPKLVVSLTGAYSWTPTTVPQRQPCGTGWPAGGWTRAVSSQPWGPGWTLGLSRGGGRRKVPRGAARCTDMSSGISVASVP
jgi:hypothetical protein